MNVTVITLCILCAPGCFEGTEGDIRPRFPGSTSQGTRRSEV